jgi:hypothetical protein
LFFGGPGVNTPETATTMASLQDLSLDEHAYVELLRRLISVSVRGATTHLVLAFSSSLYVALNRTLLHACAV